MPTPEDQLAEDILRAVERRTESILAQRGATFLPQNFAADRPGVVQSGIRMNNFATGYDGTNTTLAFTADVSLMDATTLESGDLVTM